MPDSARSQPKELEDVRDAAINCVRRAESLRRIIEATVESRQPDSAREGREAVEDLLDALIGGQNKLARVKTELARAAPRRFPLGVYVASRPGAVPEYDENIRHSCGQDERAVMVSLRNL